jgi:hypothetical protein
MSTCNPLDLKTMGYQPIMVCGSYVVPVFSFLFLHLLPITFTQQILCSNGKSTLKHVQKLD